MWGLRAQVDRELYRKNIQQEMFNTPKLSIVSGSVEDLIVESTDTVKCGGVILGMDEGFCFAIDS